MRFGGDKTFFPLAGKPMLWHTVNAFCEAETVSSVVIVTRAECVGQVRALTEGMKKVRAVIPGGDTRQDSVFLGAAALPRGTDFISVHDAARPLITPNEIDRIHREAEQTGAVCAGIPLNDTVHMVDTEGRIVATPDRAMLMAAQTPQVFPLAVYRNACKTAKGSFTDDAGMVRASGVPVRMIRCLCENFKVTRREDAQRADAILRARETPER